MYKFLIAAFVVVVGITFTASAAQAALFPVLTGNIHDTKSLQAALKARPDVLKTLIAQTGGGKATSKDFVYCGTVNGAERSKLIAAGYKNTAYDIQGNLVTLGSIKAESLAWACRVNTAKIAKSLKSRLGGGKVKCQTKKYKSGTITVICSGSNRTYTVKAPTRRAAIGKDCANPQRGGKPTTTETTVLSGYYTAWSTITVKKGETIVCDGGASATAMATAKARGFGYGRTLKAAKAMAKRNASASVKVNASCKPPEGAVIKTPVVIDGCPNMPGVQEPGTDCGGPNETDSCPNLAGAQPTVPTGYYIDANGNCVKPRFHAVADATATATATCPDGTVARSSATGHGEAWSDVSQVDADRQAKAFADAKAKANADASVQCGSTPPPVDRPPVVNIMGSPAHLYVGGNAYVWIEASDPDGDTVSVKVSASGAGTVAGLVPSAIRWDGTQCPAGKSCYRATVWASTTPGNLTVTATVTGGGKSGSPDSATFPVKPDDFG
jgi:hypothetical protein